jgi:hypothetical protein
VQDFYFSLVITGFSRLILFLISLVISANAASESRPNVLFLFTVDLRFDTVHALGNDEIYTPH